MPQKRKPARLVYRKDSGAWIIRDGDKRISTGCSEGQTREANEKLAEYIATQYQPKRGGRSAEITIADVLMVYLDEKSPGTARPKDTEGKIKRLNEFFGDKVVADIRGKLCRDFADKRGTQAGARNDLETLRAAINYYHAEYTLDQIPDVTLPDKCLPRERWLTRKEVAALIWAARKAKGCDHIVRLILIGIYTGTRLGVILGLEWMPNVNGGWIDIERGVLHRKAEKERVAHNKRKTPMKIPRRLMRFLKYWKAADTSGERHMRHIIHFNGKKITKPHKAFRGVRKDAGLGEDVTPHTLRHTRATWLAHAGVDINQAAESLGMTAAEFERTYSHSSPEFQQEAANAY